MGRKTIAMVKSLSGIGVYSDSYATMMIPRLERPPMETVRSGTSDYTGGCTCIVFRDQHCGYIPQYDLPVLKTLTSVEKTASSCLAGEASYPRDLWQYIYIIYMVTTETFD